jgi:hypothetical protein
MSHLVTSQNHPKSSITSIIKEEGGGGGRPRSLINHQHNPITTSQHTSTYHDEGVNPFKVSGGKDQVQHR